MNMYHRYALDKAESWVLIPGFRKKPFTLPCNNTMIKYHRYALDKAGSWVLIQGFRKKTFTLYNKQ